MFSYTLVNHPQSFSLNESKIQAIFQNVDREVPRSQKGIINIAFISNQEMQDFNKSYRGKDSTTDVLSFHYYDDFSNIGDDEVAGEIVLSESKIILQARQNAHSEGKETQVLVLHGLLHILGFDHETDTEYEEMSGYELPLRNYLS